MSKLLKVKTIVVGDASVGKTSLVMRALQDVAPGKPEPTIGAGNCSLTVKSGNRQVIFNIWDTAGQERYRSLTSMYFTGAGIAILVFDLTSAASLRALKTDFVPLLHGRAPPDVTLVLVGNKSDLTESREVEVTEAEAFRAECGAVFYMETSALDGTGVSDLFERLASHDGYRDQRATPFVLTKDEPPQKTSGCCA